MTFSKTKGNKNIYFVIIDKLTKTKVNDFIPCDFYILANCFIKFSVDSLGFIRKTITLAAINNFLLHPYQYLQLL